MMRAAMTAASRVNAAHVRALMSGDVVKKCFGDMVKKGL